MSSFLLNYRAMHRSIEIMTPPAMQINDEVCQFAIRMFVYIASSSQNRHLLNRDNTEAGMPVILRSKEANTAMVCMHVPTILFFLSFCQK
ncbi:hypothetical protein BC939DRAFT_452962 [Gamsiella multidivaricata]|uniref:uncharacterized protein n=1 Tax=Gamsiella multidivaricata TaxID=101098 RepID=UPI00221FF928|nr:uncharacterized protein BC939DRAFT_452962 [Gamsiella multidivaricata]KAI7822906.1 hypothetical protein BC939DRAFT_452962 [Gamsiella multidivaricata]